MRAIGSVPRAADQPVIIILVPIVENSDVATSRADLTVCATWSW
jgi:hypothetical protein